MDGRIASIAVLASALALGASAAVAAQRPASVGRTRACFDRLASWNYIFSSCFLSAAATASTRFETPSFSKMTVVWSLTTVGLMPSSLAISVSPRVPYGCRGLAQSSISLRENQSRSSDWLDGVLKSGDAPCLFRGCFCQHD